MLMKGIEVLSQQEITLNLFWFILMVFLSLLCIVGLIVTLVNKEEEIAKFCLFIGILFVGITGTMFFSPRYTKYKVLISNEVKMNDFYKKYEILEQEGKIYTIKIKESEEK